MREATCSKSWTRSGPCAKTLVSKRHKRHTRIICTLGARFDVWLLIDLSLAFFNRHDPVSRNGGYFINRPAGPTHLNRIHFRTLLEAEVQPQIALRQVTLTATHLVHLRQIAGYNCHTRTDAAAIALHPNQLDEHGVVRIPSIVAQKLRWSIQVSNQ